MGKDKWIQHILISADMKFRKEKKFRYGIPPYADLFPAVILY
jgi:hypothetical protein